MKYLLNNINVKICEGHPNDWHHIKAGNVEYLILFFFCSVVYALRGEELKKGNKRE